MGIAGFPLDVQSRAGSTDPRLVPPLPATGADFRAGVAGPPQAPRWLPVRAPWMGPRALGEVQLRGPGGAMGVFVAYTLKEEKRSYWTIGVVTCGEKRCARIQTCTFIPLTTRNHHAVSLPFQSCSGSIGALGGAEPVP